MMTSGSLGIRARERARADRPTPSQRPTRLIPAIHGAILLPILLVGANLSGALADGPAIIDSGTFTHYLRGARVGEERFVISEERTGQGASLQRAGAELNLKRGGEISRIRSALEIVGPGVLPRRYEVAISGPGQTTIVAAIVRDRLRLNVQSPEGQEMRQFLISPRSMILDEGMAHHYYFAARMLGNHASVDGTFFVPRRRAERKGTIRDLGEETTLVAGESYRLRHLVIRYAEHPENHVWLTGQRIIRVEIPEERWIAERTDAKELLLEKRTNR